MAVKPRESSKASTLAFFGAAGAVTGSRFLISNGWSHVLVDCGLFQGLKELRLRNWERFPIDPAAIDAVIMTHAHLDHSGYFPALSRDGFNRPAYVTQSTSDLCRIVLPDSGHLQEEEAEYANRKGYSKHAPALPLYTEEDALNSLGRMVPVAFDSPLEVAGGVRATFRYAGHILGAASVLLEVDGRRPRRVIFSGDLGRPFHPILYPPAPVPEADAIVVESTYGDRRHDDEGSLAFFADTLKRTAERGGVTIIPSFAVDRTEVVLYHLKRMIADGRVPEVPIFVDSPMALAALGVYKAKIAEHSAEVRNDIDAGAIDPPRLMEARTVEESIAINAMNGPMIVISASGMASGGRVLHHLANRLPDERSTVILVGYQAEGTRGRTLQSGAQAVKMLGRYVPVRAEVVTVPAFSAHADQAEIIGWLRTAPRPPEACYIVHGEPAAAGALRDEIRRQLGWNTIVARQFERVRLD